MGGQKSASAQTLSTTPSPDGELGASPPAIAPSHPKSPPLPGGPPHNPRPANPLSPPPLRPSPVTLQQQRLQTLWNGEENLGPNLQNLRPQEVIILSTPYTCSPTAAAAPPLRPGEALYPYPRPLSRLPLQVSSNATVCYWVCPSLMSFTSIQVPGVALTV